MACVAVVLSWTARNAEETGRPALLSNESAYVLWLGNNPQYDRVATDYSRFGGYSPAGMSGGTASGTVYLANIATIRETTQAEEVMRYNMRRTVSITANSATADLGSVRKQVLSAVADAGEPPRGILVDVRGQLDSLHQIQTSLGRGLLAAVA